MRLEPRDGERIDRARAVSFTFAGWKVTGFEGDTIASAAFAAGKRVFSRSFKYHRPRGLLCCSGHCPNCQMTVDGVPNVRVCTEPIREGAVVEGQNVRWSLDFDLMSITDKIGGPFTPVGFYYRTLHPPARGVAAVREVPAQRGRARQARSRTPATRGATTPSTAGRACSSSAAARRVAPRRSTRRRAARASSSSTRTRACADLVLAGVEVLAPARALGIWEGGLVPVDADTVLYRFRAERIVVATGATEQPLVFPGNDLVGVMLPDGVRRLIRDFSIKPGERAVVLGADDETLAIAAELERDRRGGREGRRPARRTTARARGAGRQGSRAPARPRRRERSTATSSSPPADGSPRTRCSRRPADASSSTTLSASSSRPSFRPGSRRSGASPARASRKIAPEPAYDGKGKCFVCVCEDVTTKDMKRAIGEGFDSIELAKRYTTTTMGPCQGKLCHLSSIRVYAQENRDVRGGDRDDDRATAVVAGRARACSPDASSTPARRGVDPLAPRGGGRDDPVGGPVEAAVRVRRAVRRTRCARCTSRSA